VVEWYQFYFLSLLANIVWTKDIISITNNKILLYASSCHNENIIKDFILSNTRPPCSFESSYSCLDNELVYFPFLGRFMYLIRNAHLSHASSGKVYLTIEKLGSIHKFVRKGLWWSYANKTFPNLSSTSSFTCDNQNVHRSTPGHICPSVYIIVSL
jgi:hypothetical protein